jgi:hypothetical protein
VTEFPTGEGTLYLAGVRNLFHRGIVGWDTSAKRDSILVVNALTMALVRSGNPAGVIHHSDKGSISTSLDFAFSAGNNDVHLSFGSTGDCFDNAAMETFWARLKVEIEWIRGSIRFNTHAEVPPLGPVTDRVLAEGPAANGPLPGLLPFNTYASTGAAHFADGSWAWTVGWSWISANKGTLPDGTPAGYDWSLNLSSVPAGVSAEVPPTATHLMTTSAFEFYSQNSSCEFGEGTATSTSVWVLRDGVVVAVGTLSETVADCAWDARTMSPGELVGTLAALTDCSFGDGKLPTCTPVEPLSSAARAAAEESLRKPGQ